MDRSPHGSYVKGGPHESIQRVRTNHLRLRVCLVMLAIFFIISLILNIIFMFTINSFKLQINHLNENLVDLKQILAGVSVTIIDSKDSKLPQSSSYRRGYVTAEDLSTEREFVKNIKFKK